MTTLILLLRVLAVVLVLISSKWNPPFIQLGWLGLGVWLATDLLAGTGGP